MSEISADHGTVVVLTALDLEYQAVRDYLDEPCLRPHQAGTLFEVGALPGAPWQVALSVVGDGNQGAAVLAERAIAMFRPAVLLFVGVAGALKSDLELGDVVVATRVYGYHGGKEEGGEFLARPRTWEIPHHLDQLARHIARTDRWQPPSPDRAGQRRPTVHFRPVAAGEVVLNSPASPLAEQLRRHYSNAAAIEMESAGVAQAAHLNLALPAITIRGISDRADGGKYEADDAGWQPVAAAHAAAFAVALLAELPAGQPTGTASTIDLASHGDPQPLPASADRPLRAVSSDERSQRRTPTLTTSNTVPLAGHRHRRGLTGRRRLMIAAVAVLLTLSTAAILITSTRPPRSPQTPRLAQSQQTPVQTRSPQTPQQTPARQTPDQTQSPQTPSRSQPSSATPAPSRAWRSAPTAKPSPPAATTTPCGCGASQAGASSANPSPATPTTS